MKKFKMFSSLIAEEEWINAVQAQGYRLVGVNPYPAQYEFVSQEEGGPTVRLDFQPDLSGPDYTNYLTLFQDAGWAVIPGSQKDHISYFQMTDQARDDVIFSDEASRKAFKKRYQRHCLLWATLLGLNTIHLRYLLHFSFNPNKWDIWPKFDGLGWADVLWELFRFSVEFFLRTPIPPLLMASICLYYLYLAWKAGRD